MIVNTEEEEEKKKKRKKKMGGGGRGGSRSGWEAEKPNNSLKSVAGAKLMVHTVEDYHILMGQGVVIGRHSRLQGLETECSLRCIYIDFFSSSPSGGHKHAPLSWMSSDTKCVPHPGLTRFSSL